MVDKRTVRAGYDAITDAYAERRTDDGEERAVVETFLAAVPEGGRVLDAGCGRGEPVLARQAGGTTGVGMDLSRGQLRAASEQASAALVQGDMTRLPFAADSFDAVTALYSLIHLPEDEHPAAVAEFARVLGPGGRVLVVEGTSEWTGTNPNWLDAGAEMQWHIAGPAATREHLRGAGFEVVDERVVRSALADEDAAWQLFEARLRG